MRSLKRATMNTPLNDAFIPSQATRSSDRPRAPDTRLRGRRLILARVVWIAAVTLIVALFLVMIPAFYHSTSDLLHRCYVWFHDAEAWPLNRRLCLLHPRAL